VLEHRIFFSYLTDRQNIAQVTAHTTCTRQMQTSDLCWGNSM